MFLHPMWSSESERIGKRRCTPLGYSLHISADLIGFMGLILFLLIPALLAYRWFLGSFQAAQGWFMTVPFGFGIVGQILFQTSWVLAQRKNFRYDDEQREASWIEAGERRTYRWQPGETR